MNIFVQTRYFIHLCRLVIILTMGTFLKDDFYPVKTISFAILYTTKNNATIIAVQGEKATLKTIHNLILIKNV